MRVRCTRTPNVGVFVLVALAGCHGGPAMAPEEGVVTLHFSGTVSGIKHSDQGIPPEGIEAGDPAIVTVSYTPNADVVNGDDMVGARRYIFLPESDAQVSFAIGDHVWQMSLWEMQVSNDYRQQDVVRWYSGRNGIDSTLGSLRVADHILPLDLVYDNSVPSGDGGFDPSSITTGSARVHTVWSQDVVHNGVWWQVDVEIQPSESKRSPN